MSDDVKRVAAALSRAHGPGTLDWCVLAPRVLAAIRAATEQAARSFGYTELAERFPSVPIAALDAALAALTDHPGGSEK